MAPSAAIAKFLVEEKDDYNYKAPMKISWHFHLPGM